MINILSCWLYRSFNINNMIILHDFKNFQEFRDSEVKPEGQNETQTENEIFHLLDVCPNTNGAPMAEFLHRLPYQIQVTEGYLKVSESRTN